MAVQQQAQAAAPLPIITSGPMPVHKRMLLQPD